MRSAHKHTRQRKEIHIPIIFLQHKAHPGSRTTNGRYSDVMPNKIYYTIIYEMNKWRLRLRQNIHILRLLWTQIIYYVYYFVAYFSGCVLTHTHTKACIHTQRTEVLGNIITCNIKLLQQSKIHCEVSHPQWIINCIQKYKKGDVQCIIRYLSPFQSAEVNDYCVSKTKL